MDGQRDWAAESSAWREVAARANELSFGRATAADATVEPELEPRLAQWIECSAAGDPAVFAKHLAWDGRGIADAVDALRRSDVAVEPPAWWATFAGLRRAWRRFHELYPSLAEKRTVAAGITRRELPFQEIFVPVVLAARRALLCSARAVRAAYSASCGRWAAAS